MEVNTLNKSRWVVLVFLLGIALVSCQKSGSSPDVGKIAPPISLSDLNGNTVSLESLKGKVVIINLWSYT
jgi:cytochrome oxidase Cu insertion factor (SCO1/SenC/PrrC family)